MKNPGKTKPAGKQNKGFRAMDPKLQREIASQGGKAVMARKGWAAEIGSRGGQNSHRGDSARRKLVVSKRKG